MNHANRLTLLPLFLIAACGSSEAPEVPADELAAAASEHEVEEFYEENGLEGVWSHEAEQALVQAIEGRAEHGLDRVAFLESEPPSPAAREAALTSAALTYASALARGLVDPNEQYRIYTVPRPDPDLAAGLTEALDAGRVGEWLASLAPDDAEYRALSETYLRLRREAGDAERTAIPGGDLIRQGDSDPRVPQIAAELRRQGYLGEAAPADEGAGEGEVAEPAPPQEFTAEIAYALGRFQQARGIAADKVFGPVTLQALNRGPADYARAAAVALERRRWLMRKPPANRIDVNTGIAMLHYYRDGNLADRRRVVVGQPGWQTPQLQSQFFRLVANPTWTVPKSIERDEMAGVGAAYLRRNNMVRRNGWIVQLPGPGNSLGLVKFDLDNRYAIYLHDTPAKALFESNQRHRSHGCVRVSDALGFASMIAEDQGITGQWEQARASSRENRFLPLPEPLQVRLLYHPTYLDPELGEIRFAPDTYNRNGPVAEALGFGPGGPRRAVPHVPSIGP